MADKTSYKGICELLREEAIVLVPYPDGKEGEFSIGAGHLDKALKADSPAITVEEAMRLFAEDMTPREAFVSKVVKVPIEQHQFDALVSLYYNKGSLLLPVATMLNDGRVGDAMAQMLTINRNAKDEWKLGLAKRRMREVQMFMEADYTDKEAVPPKLKLYRERPTATNHEFVDFPPETA